MAVLAAVGVGVILYLLISRSGYYQPYDVARYECPSVMYGLYISEQEQSTYWVSAEGQARELFCSSQHEARLGLSVLIAIPTTVLGSVAWSRWPRD